MFSRILREFRQRIRDADYIVTIHADEEMDEDGLTIFDVEEIILCGRIAARQKDRETGEWKYLIRGETISGEEAIVVAKRSVTGKLVIVTVYVEHVE
ncbi:MAG TPA: DUF4258 domain-containing protein [Planctomycetota bacterium]|nr:DUF4258 domain-containing protein [Planctomycetota bacterium]